MRRAWLATSLLVLSLPLFASPRVISLAPFLTDMVVQLHAEHLLVGVLDDGLLPAALDDIPRVGGYQTLSRERLLSLNPDLVLAWTSGNPPELLSQLETWGIQVARFDPQKLEDMGELTEKLGQLLQAEARADELAAHYQARLAALQRPLTDSAPRVFIQLWDDPIYTISDQQMLGDVLRHCGARNVFADLGILAPQIGREHVIAADPDLIIVFDDVTAQPHPWLEAWRQFPQLRAVQHNQLKVVDGDSLVRPSPRMLDAVEALCDLVWMAVEQN